MKKHILTLAFTCIITTLFAQQKFSIIKVENASKIFISQDSTWSVKESGSGEVVNMRIADDMLIVEGSGTNYTITTPNLKKIMMDGMGSVSGQNTFSGESLELEMKGSGSVNINVNYKNVNASLSGMGKITVSGNAEYAKFSVPGSGKIDGSELKVKKADVSISGMGKCVIDASDELNADISGTGAVSYRTMPKVLNQNITGLGKVKQFDTLSVSQRVDTTKLDFGNSSVWILKKAHKKSEEKAKPIWAGLELGFNNYVNREGKFDLAPGLDNWDLKFGKSVYVALNFYQKNIELGKSNVWLVTGMGISWNNYRFDNDVRLIDGPVVTAVRDTNPAIRSIKSKLTASYLNVPLMLEFLTSRSEKKAFHLGAGAIVGLRLGSHTKIKFEENGDTKKDKQHEDFNLNTFRYGFRVAIGYGNLNLFADYYASTLFKENRGPILYPVTAGITLLGF